MTDIESLKLSIEEHLQRAILADSTKAMQHAYEAKELVQRFYYAIWHSHHTSGGGPTKATPPASSRAG